MITINDICNESIKQNAIPVSFARLTTGNQWKGWHYYRYQHGLKKYGLDISKLFLS